MGFSSALLLFHYFLFFSRFLLISNVFKVPLRLAILDGHVFMNGCAPCGAFFLEPFPASWSWCWGTCRCCLRAALAVADVPLTNDDYTVTVPKKDPAAEEGCVSRTLSRHTQRVTRRDSVGQSQGAR